MKVTVSFDAQAQRAPCTVKLNNYTSLTPRSAIAARDIAAGKGANATVSDGGTAYRVTKNRARKIR